jgi:hypothetical protein
MVTSFSIDVDGTYDEVLAAVTDVAKNGVVSGTFEYRGDENLPGAELATTCSFFEPWNGPGKVLCKIRKRALSPAHFIDSNDVGTVAVRYIVQHLSEHSTRLFIDAVFEENSHHHPHASDGYVETTEFAEVARILKEAQDAAIVRPSVPLDINHQSSSRTIDVESPLPASDAVALQRVLAEERAKLQADQSVLDELQAQARTAEAGRELRVNAERSEIRAYPYSHSEVVAPVSRGENLILLSRSTHWYEVRASDGRHGWIRQESVQVSR